MEHILTEGDGTIQYGRYLEYLATIKGALPPHVYEFASSEQYFALNSPGSLHDAWLQSVFVTELRNTTRPFEPEVNLTIKLLGQAHDRVILLEYRKVSRYSLTGKQSEFNSADTFHGDVHTHEVRFGGNGCIVHEILFVSDSSILVECADFSHHEVPLPSLQ